MKPKGCLKTALLPSRQAAKPQQLQRLVLGRAGWLRPQAFEEEMPSLGQAGSQLLSPESTREKQKAVAGKGEHR